MPKDTLAYDDVAERIDFSVVTGASAMARDSERKQDAVSRLMKAWENKNAQRAAKGLGLTMVAVSLAACGTEAEPTPEPVPVEPEPPVNLTLTLTEAMGEQVIGGAGDDTFIAVLDGEVNGTLQQGDQIVGGEGRDTLNLYIVSSSEAPNGLPPGVSISGVEVINLYGLDDDLGTFNATAFAGAEEIWQFVEYANVRAIGSNVTVGFGGDTGDIDVNLRFTGDTANIALATTGDGDYHEFNIRGSNVTTLNISGSSYDDSGRSYSSIEIYDDGDADENNSLTKLSTINVAMKTNTWFDMQDLPNGPEYLAFHTFDASASTGSIGLEYTESLNNVRFGSGDDVLFYSSGFAHKHTTSDSHVNVNMGSGNDVVYLDLYNVDEYADEFDGGENNLSLTLTLGAGRDIVVLFNPGEVAGNVSFSNIRDAREGEFMKNIVKITDFNPSQDLILLDGSSPFFDHFGSTKDVFVYDYASYGYTVSGRSTTSIDGNMEVQTSLFKALNKAAELLEEEGADVMVFKFGGSTYIYHHYNDSGTFEDGDGLIELTGFTGDWSKSILFADGGEL
jgi:hypothetical protein